MPRKVRFHPSVMGGEPADGDDWNEAADDEGGETGGDRAEPKARAPEEDRIALLQAEVDRLKRQIPPPEPTRSEAVAADPTDEMTDEEFDALLFSNPREALRLNNERVKKELRTEYTANQGTQSFWQQFYAANGDLKDDDDLVQSTLQKNMAELGNMPVPEAMARLAVLTRDRILGFMKKRKEPRTSRAVAEGATPPAVPQAQDDEAEPAAGTLSGVLTARRMRRRSAAQAA